MIFADMVDSYKNLTLKVVHGLAWADKFCRRFDFLVKVDSDVFFNPFPLVDYFYDRNLFSDPDLEFVGKHFRAFVCPSVHLSVHSSVRLSVKSVFFNPFPLVDYFYDRNLFSDPDLEFVGNHFRAFVCRSVSLSVCPFICPSVSQIRLLLQPVSARRLLIRSECLPIRIWRLSERIFDNRSVYPPICLAVQYIFLCFCPTVLLSGSQL